MRLELTAAEYHQNERMSRSRLLEFSNDPLLFSQTYIHKTAKPRAATDQMLWGSDVESLYFNDTLHNATVVPDDLLTAGGRVPSNGEKREAYLEWVDRQKGRRVFKSGEYDARRNEVARAVFQLRACQKARALLQGEYHIRLGFEYRDIEWRCEFDVLNSNAQLLDDAGLYLPNGAIVDLKTSARNDAKSFSSSCVEYYYHVQAWLYQYAWQLETGERLPVVFVVQKNKPSYSVEIYEASAEMINLGQEDADRAIDHYLTCLETGDWYSPSFGQVRTLDPPRWARYREEWTA